MNAALLKEFAKPDSRFRGKPFWAWNGTLEPDELRRQIRLMKRMGLGGFFMHSRVGLDTAYLAEEWFRCVDACIDEAKKQRMQAWLYDEDRWPSGAAGGLVTKDPRFRKRSIVLDVLTDVKGTIWTANTVAAFTARVDGRRAGDVKRLPVGAKAPLDKGLSVLRFRDEVDGCNDWYNGYTYLDTLNPRAVREFIKVTHEAYRKHSRHDFGSVIPGIFTDEPNYGGVMGQAGTRAPWTGVLPATFRKRHGYPIAEHLPALFFDTDDPRGTMVRYHYIETITFLFVEAFSKQIGEWCERNGILSTGHMLAEETLSSQTDVVGACMRHYEHMQAPGMDLLTEYNREYDTAKQVSSVAHQFGRKWRLTETYGCTGWDFPLAGHKALGDWQAALGINLRCQHLAWYTMLGQAKRDYPAGIFYQSPWWELYPAVEDYFARITAVMTRGQEVRDVLVIHPVESMWLHVRSDWRKDPAVAALDRMIVDLRDTLLAAHLDFDYGDEDIIARHGRVSKGAAGPSLTVAKARYTVVVVPPLETIRSSTLRLLDRFIDAGGVVIQAGSPSGLVDAVRSDAARDLAKRCVRAPAKGRGLAEAVGGHGGRRLSIVDQTDSEIAPALYLLREDRDGYYLFVCNTGHDFRPLPATWITHDSPVRERNDQFAFVSIRGFGDCRGFPIELDPQTGERHAAEAEQIGGEWCLATSLPKLGSRLFMIPKAKQRSTPRPRPSLRDVRTHGILKRRWDIRLSEPNVLVLDRPHYSIGGGREHAPEEILIVDRKVRDTLGVRHRGGAMVQPWARQRSASPKSIAVRLRYVFDVKAETMGDLQLAVEEPGRYRVSVNGVSLVTDVETGWWCDRSLRTLRVNPALLRTGENEIVLAGDYDENHPGLEIAYLLGTFGVRVSDTTVTMVDPVHALSLGDWGKQGLPFYSGSVGYTATVGTKLHSGERLFVRVPAYAGAGVRVLIDGAPAGTIAWEPNEVDITDFIKGPTATLCIEVVSHRRNSHGPLHLKTKHPGWTGPEQFVTHSHDWVEGYHLVACGLTKPPELVVRR